MRTAIRIGDDDSGDTLELSKDETRFMCVRMISEQDEDSELSIYIEPSKLIEAVNALLRLQGPQQQTFSEA